MVIKQSYHLMFNVIIVLICINKKYCSQFIVSILQVSIYIPNKVFVNVYLKVENDLLNKKFLIGFVDC